MATPKRPIRVGNCSGAEVDPGIYMYQQAKLGPVDVITGDYLAEATIALEADAYNKGERSGWCQTAWDGLQCSAEIIAEKNIKVIINGGSLNPKGLAHKVHELFRSKGLALTVAYVDGDNLFDRIGEVLSKSKGSGDLPHLDGDNANVKLDKDSKLFLQYPERNSIIAANGYLGSRAIRKGLDQGADVIICGRVADASPVVGAASWWHSWADDDFDALAGALVAGHLIECSTYVTGANFAGFYQYEIPNLLDLPLPIVEVEANGDCIVTKHEGTSGIVSADTVKCQFLYELQGNIYLNNDVKADYKNIKIEQVAENRVQVSGSKGYTPPPTTKLAVFYKGGYQCELLQNAVGYATAKKWALYEAQLKHRLQEFNVLDKFDVLDFQYVGRPEENPSCQLASTTYMRVFAQAQDKDVLSKIMTATSYNGMQHFAGQCRSRDMRTVVPKPYVAFYPSVIQQSELEEAVTIIHDNGKVSRTVVGPPPKTEPLGPREDYETISPVDISSFGDTELAPLGDIVLGRSGDKGANINLGLFVQSDEEWHWLRSFMTKAKLKAMMGSDWQDWYYIERCEMPVIRSVHFVIYGPLGRGVTSSKLLDNLGKGFAEFVRAVHVPIPKRFLNAR